MSMLKPRKRITKKQMKQDKFVSTTFQIQEFIRSKSRQVLYGAAGLLILIIVFSIMTGQTRKKEQRASVQLSQAQLYYQSGDYATSAGMFSDIVNRFKGTQSASQSTFYLANCHFFNGNYESALEYFEKYLHGSHQNSAFKASALAGIAACHEQKGSYGKAAEYYERAASEHRDFYAAPDYLIAAGRCYESTGDMEKARRIYQEVVDEYPNAKSLPQAKLALAQL